LQQIENLSILDEIIKKTVQAIEKSKNQIFDIAEMSRREYKRIQRELQELCQQTAEVIVQVDQAEKRDRQGRNHLMKVSKNFNFLSENHIRQAYEEAKEAQIEFILLKAKEKDLRRRRDELEFTLRGMKDAVYKAEELISQVGVALEYLSGNLKNFSVHIGDVQQKYKLGLGIIRAQEEERKRLAREIHDGPAQSLANTVLRVELCEKLIERDLQKTKNELSELKQIVKDSLQDVRRIIFDLRPMALDDLGFIPALHRFLDCFQEKHDIQVSLMNIGNFKKMSTSLQIALFRLVQECLNNVQKHAHVNCASVKIEFVEQKVNVLVEDKGTGFFWEKIKKEKKESFGLLGMEERVKLLGGRFQVISALGKGTKILITIPLQL